MADEPLILVVGGNSLAFRVCEELCSTKGHKVALVWPQSAEVARTISRIEGCEYRPHAPNDYDGLRDAGVMEATSIMALDESDPVNLQIALKARDLNPKIRVVLRQFNRTLGNKLEQNLPNCSVFSMETQAAAVFVGEALDRSCFFALQFPDRVGVLCGFSERAAEEFGIVGMDRREAQAHLRMRVIALDGKTEWEFAHHRFTAGQRVICFGQIRQLMGSTRGDEVVRIRARPQQAAASARRYWTQLQRMDPILRNILIAAVLAIVISTVYFGGALKKDAITALYFVLTTMTSTGYGDITPLESGPVAKMVSNVLMIAGLALSGIFIAFATSALTRAQWTAMQGLRQIRTRKHVLVCGAGNVGQRVVEFLRMLDQRVVVVDPAPDNALIEASRSREIELLTGDATRDATLDLCNVDGARSVVAITSAEITNLEVSLGVRGRSADMQVIMRVHDDVFAGSIARQFEGIQTLSTSALSAPALAGLSRFPGTRARIAFGGDDYNVGERLQGEKPAPPPANFCVALAVWRGGSFLHINDFDEMEPFDRLIFIVPLSQFRAGAPPRERQAAPHANPR